MKPTIRIELSSERRIIVRPNGSVRLFFEGISRQGENWSSIEEFDRERQEPLLVSRIVVIQKPKEVSLQEFSPVRRFSSLEEVYSLGNDLAYQQTVRIGFQIQQQQLLIVEPDGQVSFAVLNPQTHEVHLGIPIFVSVDDYDANRLSDKFKTSVLGVTMEGRWIEIERSCSEEKPSRFDSLRHAYLYLTEKVRKIGYEVFELGKERIYGAPAIPGH